MFHFDKLFVPEMFNLIKKSKPEDDRLLDMQPVETPA